MLHDDPADHFLHLSFHGFCHLLLLSVRLQVLVQIVGLIESTIAKVALEWLLAGMNSQAVGEKLFALAIHKN